MLSETQSGSALFAFLASVFNSDAVKKSVTEKATVLLVPSVAQDTKAKEEAAARTAAGAADGKEQEDLAVRGAVDHGNRMVVAYLFPHAVQQAVEQRN